MLCINAWGNAVMAAKRILTVGFELASSDVQYADFNSDTSLLDWDIVLFKPVIDGYLSNSDFYQGKPSLSDYSSFQLKERCEHWHREIKDAVESGKTVVVFLCELQEVHVDTGQRRYSGTGRNQKTTRIVSLYNNYASIPARLNPIGTKGSAIKLASRDTEAISMYWKEFEEISQYKVVLAEETVPACLVTKNGDKPVGALYRSKNSNGALVLLPDIDFSPKDFIKQKGEQLSWTPVAKRFASRMVGIVVALDKALHSTGEVTPAPQWASSPDYALAQEVRLNQEILKAEEQLEKARSAKEAVLEELKASRRLRSLLFEKGKPLENAIIDGLTILGFRAAPFKDSNSEFDVVFESEEGRLIGEAEGKDNKAINVDKLRQLAMNIHEDLQREEVTKPAKGVLFGNAYRLSPLADRDTPFTEKCISAAQSSSTALLSTPELFRAVRCLLNNPSDDYARSCRQAILGGVGIVTFPPAPEMEAETEIQQAVGDDT